jgi:hypothetical protein
VVEAVVAEARRFEGAQAELFVQVRLEKGGQLGVFLVSGGTRGHQNGSGEQGEGPAEHGKLRQRLRGEVTLPQIR